MADLSPEFVKAFNALPPDQQAAIRALGVQQNTPGQQFIPTVQDGRIVIPATGTPRPDAPTAVAQAPVARQEDTSAAVAQTSSFLRSLGLDDLIPDVENLIRSGTSPAQVENMLYDRSTTLGKKLDALVPEYWQRIANGYKPAPIQEILSSRDAYKRLFSSAGVEVTPEIQQYIRDNISNDVSAVEFKQERWDPGVARLLNDAPPEYISELQRVYGLSVGQQVLQVLDPKVAASQVQKQAQAAILGGISQQTGFGANSRAELERLASLGVTDSQAQQGFGALAGLGEATTALVGTGEQAISRQDQLGAVFEGNTAAARRIAQRQKARTSTFDQGGGFASGPEGFAGVGTAR